MTVYSDRLREMISDAPDQSDNLANNISQVTDIRDDVQDQIDAVTTGLCGVAATDLQSYLNTVKLPAFQLLYPTATLTIGGTYGSIDYSTGNITDWKISYISLVGLPPVPTEVILYQYEGTGWDSDANIIKWVGDYDYGNDYLTRPLTSGATYGLIPYRDNLDTALSILEENKDKIDATEVHLEDYAT